MLWADRSLKVHSGRLERNLGFYLGDKKEIWMCVGSGLREF